MIRNSPKSTTSTLDEIWSEQVVFFSNAPEATETAPGRRTLTSQCTHSQKPYSNITKLNSFHESYDSIATHTRWEFKINSTPCLPVVADRKTSKGIVTDYVHEAKHLIYKWEKTKQGKIASFYSVFIIETMYKNREFEEINRLLKEVDVSSLTEWSMIALLRSSYQARKHLPAWTLLLGAVTHKLKNDGKDYNRLLSGLIR